MSDYKTGLADEATGKSKAIRAVIEYGRALLEGRNRDRSNVSFKQWVSDNDLDIGKPWADRKEREKSMRIAELFDGGKAPPNTFDTCPYTRPTDIMKWYRKMLAPATDKEEKPTKPKQEKPKQEAVVAAPEKPKSPSTPATDAAYEDITNWLKSGKEIPNQRKWADERKDIASHASYEKAFDRLNREAVERAEAATSEDAALARAEAGFSDKSKLALADAIRIHKARLDKTFEQLVSEEVRKRIATADNAVRERLKKADATILTFERERGKKGVFSKSEFNQMLKLCHPDDPASPETRGALLQVLLKYKTHLINPERE